MKSGSQCLIILGSILAELINFQLQSVISSFSFCMVLGFFFFNLFCCVVGSDLKADVAAILHREVFLLEIYFCLI